MSSYSIDIINVKNRQYIPCFEKNASAADQEAFDEVSNAMKVVYDENPEYWPYGLNIAGHDSVYAIRDNATEKIAGWVGWQEHYDDNGKKVGSYSIGILPEYRGKGLAKEAVAKIIMEKVAHVDRVVSYIVPGNKASESLAHSLHIPVDNNF